MFSPAVVENKPVAVNPVAEKIVTPPVTEPTSLAAEITAEITAETTAEIIAEKSATTTEVAPASSFKFTPITFESKTPAKAAVSKKAATKKSPVAKAPGTKASSIKPPATKSSNIKTPIAKVFGSKVLTPKASASKSTAKVTPIATKSIRPTRSTRTPLPKAAKASSPVSTTASLAIRDKKPQPTAEEIEKARLEAERKLERSKRFGIKMDEKDMKEIRAARFGITPVEKKDEVKQVKPAAAAGKKETAQDILKKRAERFGIPEKKIVPVKKTPVKSQVNNKTNTAKLNTATKNQVKQGRVQKMAPKTVLISKKTVIKTAIKSNILNKNQGNATSRLRGPTVTQNKRAIINHRKVNVTNNNKLQDRVVTIAPIKTAPVRQMKTSARDIIINANNNIRRPATNAKRPLANDIGNGRTVTVGPTTNAPNKRRKGRGVEPPHQPTNRKRRN